MTSKVKFKFNYYNFKKKNELVKFIWFEKIFFQFKWYSEEQIHTLDIKYIYIPNIFKEWESSFFGGFFSMYSHLNPLTQITQIVKYMYFSYFL